MDGKVALISGAARGQGAAEARAFVTEGARVVIGDILDGEGKTLADELGEGALYVTLDVTDEEAWKAAVATATSTFGKLTTLVNNAGISPLPTPILDMDVATYRKVIEVNQISAFMGTKFAARAIADAGGGTIVNISSVNGIVGAAGIAGYVSSKFALRGFTKTAALELGSLGIRVNSVHPGPIDTAMLSPDNFGGFDMRPMLKGLLPVGRIGTAEEVAELVVWLSSDASSFCTGSEFVIDGGFLAGPLLRG
jgi:3alpha(or 20beta)-hydroxysteroid dehydrogenase